mmetsp:Transcript_30089/g.87643  ORF Transcript_30089/g.87643 Transcript_30089/m.87643 type:complete len:243 (+) Transcript_30089:213-941(+)
MNDVVGLAFAFRVSHVSEEGVSQGPSHGDPVIRVESERFFEQSNSVRVEVREPIGEVDSGVLREVQDESSSLGVCYKFQFFGLGPAHELHDQLQLVDVVASRKDRFLGQHLGKDARDGPDVDLGVIGRTGQHDLWGAVPPSDHVLGEVLLLLSVGDATGEPKVAQLEVAIRIQENIGGLEVPVNYPSGMNVIQTAKHLIHEELYVVRGKLLLRVDDTLQVCLHEVGYDVHVIKVLLLVWGHE